MIVIARQADLHLPEYAAFDSDRPHPGAPDWESAFAFALSRLSNTSLVLDCAAESGRLRERVLRLYPGVTYHHRNPFRGERLSLPINSPAETYDRVFCVNTLGRMPKARQEELVADMARKLNPGGLLIITCDLPLRPDARGREGAEGGSAPAESEAGAGAWRTPAEWVALCRNYDLHPVGEVADDWREVDTPLLADGAPRPAALLGGVFYKTHAPRPAGKVIALALLCWNLREIAVESLRAQIREAQMIRRMGHEPFLCVCDNGSDDGTAEALASLKELDDVPHRLILNRENRGNALARNQIINCMLERDADYLFFNDGDAEVVPFSTFAMFRHMENGGPRLGALGASRFGDSVETTRRDEASKCLYHVDERLVERWDSIAPTWYGMYRRAVFEDGVRFEESGPFEGAGWGFEDNDLGFQMVVKGYRIELFTGLTVLHRAAYSSIGIMREKGIDAEGVYYRRKQFVIDKWAAVPAINDGPLRIIRACEFPLPR